MQNPLDDATYPTHRAPRSGGLFRPADPLESVFPIRRVEIDWDRLIAKRPLILKTVEQMPVYLLKPEVLGLLATEKHPAYRRYYYFGYFIIHTLGMILRGGGIDEQQR